MKKFLIITNNDEKDQYIGRAFESLGTVVTFSNFYNIYYNPSAEGGTEEERNNINLLQNCDVVICTGDIRKKGEFIDLMNDGTNVVDVIRLCDILNKKLVLISTADLYGNYFKYSDDVETSHKLDVGTDYRFLRLLFEKIALDHTNNLVIRVRNCFDDRIHPDNALIQGYMADKLYAWADSWSYLPDVVKAVKTLVKSNETGIWNVVQNDCASFFYLLKSVIKIPFFKKLDPIKEDLENFLIKEFDNERIHNDVNNEKIKDRVDFAPLDAAALISWQGIKEHFYSNFNEEKFLQKLQGAVESLHEHSTTDHQS